VKRVEPQKLFAGSACWPSCFVGGSFQVGNPRTMGATQYLRTPGPAGLLGAGAPFVGSGVVGAVANFWATRFGKALEAGVRRSRRKQSPWFFPQRAFARHFFS
jgi:hypothetical protein